MCVERMRKGHHYVGSCIGSEYHLGHTPGTALTWPHAQQCQGSSAIVAPVVIQICSCTAQPCLHKPARAAMSSWCKSKDLICSSYSHDQIYCWNRGYVWEVVLMPGRVVMISERLQKA